MTILVMPGVYNECLKLGTFNLQGDLQPFPTYQDREVHLIADAWDEATVLQTLAHLQRTGAAEAIRPDSHVPLPYG